MELKFHLKKITTVDQENPWIKYVLKAWPDGVEEVQIMVKFGGYVPDDWKELLGRVDGDTCKVIIGPETRQATMAEASAEVEST